MKIVQLNMWGGRLMPGVLQMLHCENPDIICLQEVFSSPQGNTVFDTNNLEVLQDEFPDYHFYYAPIFDVDCEKAKTHFGNLIFARYPITHKETVFTADPYIEGLISRDVYYYVRNFQHAVIDTPDGKINIINHHAQPNKGKLGNDDITRQMNMIVDHIKSLTGPIVVTGDFNLLPEAPSLLPLNQSLNNLSMTHDIQTTRTQFYKTDQHVCDYIFVDDAIIVDEFKVLDDLISDHSPLMASIRV